MHRKVPAWFGGKLRRNGPAPAGHLAARLTLCHAREHLHDLGSLVSFMLGAGYPTATPTGPPHGWPILTTATFAALCAAARALPLAGRKACERERAAGILTLLCPEASNRWEQIWPQPHNQTGAA